MFVFFLLQRSQISSQTSTDMSLLCVGVCFLCMYICVWLFEVSVKDQNGGLLSFLRRINRALLVTLCGKCVVVTTVLAGAPGIWYLPTNIRALTNHNLSSPSSMTNQNLPSVSSLTNHNLPSVSSLTNHNLPFHSSRNVVHHALPCPHPPDVPVVT